MIIITLSNEGKVIPIVIFCAILAASIIIPIVVIDAFNNFDVSDEPDIEVCWGDTIVITWTFNNLNDCSEAHYTIIGKDANITGDSDSSAKVTINSTPSVGTYTYTITADCGSESDSDTVEVTVLSPAHSDCSPPPSSSFSGIPGFEPFLFLGTFLSLGAVVIVVFHQKFKKQVIN